MQVDTSVYPTRICGYLTVMTKIKYVYMEDKLNGYQTDINIYNIPIINGYPRVKMEGCYVDTNYVYVISRMNGYQIVLIDGYDKPETTCHGTAKIATA